MNIFKTIQLGKEPNLKGFQISERAENLLKEVRYSKKKQELDLVVVSVEDIGFPNGAELKDVYTKAKKLGLELCPAEVGPFLRLNYKEQPNGEWLLIAMEPITGSGGSLRVFCVAHGDGGLWLYGYGDPDDFWFGYDRFVFVRPRKLASLSFESLPSLEYRILELEKFRKSVEKVFDFLRTYK